MGDKVDFTEDFGITEPSIKNLLLDIVPTAAGVASCPFPCPHTASPPTCRIRPPSFFAFQLVPPKSTQDLQILLLLLPRTEKSPPTSRYKGL